jgi:hypothetical protein
MLKVSPDLLRNNESWADFVIGHRNPLAIAIDPYLNLFTRDNTNDGAGWDVRVSHLIQTADYGYSQRFANFPDEIMPPLDAHGQGGGTGTFALDDDRWSEAYRGALLTGDWGRSEVYRHDLKPAGATFRADQNVFLSIPRPTGMELGGDGRLYVASWRGGEASVCVGPQGGFLARARRRRAGAVPRRPGRSLARRPGSGRDRAWKPPRRSSGAEPRPADFTS